MADYKTKQGEMILNYLKDCAPSHVSAADIAAHLRSGSHNVGMATVYRRLEKMVEAGCVRKYCLDTGA